MVSLREVLIRCLNSLAYMGPIDDEDQLSVGEVPGEKLVVQIYIRQKNAKIDTWLCPLDLFTRMQGID